MTPADADVPFLPRGVRMHRCKVRETWFLLAPERAMKLDDIGAAILGVVDGERSLAGIAAKLAADYNAPADMITGDARTFLAELMYRRMVEVR
jgi:pyrroloquinoline quinone biosynthesis protein D